MSLTPVKYPLDLTGAAASNRVTDEAYTLNSASVRVLIPQNGAFFTQAVVLKDANTHRTLVMYQDYYPSLLYTEPTAQTGQEIHQILVITDASCSPNVLFSGQMLGGEYSYSYDAIVQLINRLNLDNRPILFDNIIGKPDGYPPAPHLHDAGDMYGVEYVAAALDRIRDAVLLGSAAGQKSIYDYIAGQIAQLQGNLDAISSVNLTPLAIIKALKYVPANIAGDNFIGPVGFKAGVYQQSSMRTLVQSVTAAGPNTVLDVSKGNVFKVTLAANTNLQFDVSKVLGITGNDYFKISVLLINDAAAGRVLGFTSTVQWPNQSQPARNTAANTRSEYEFSTYDGGVTWEGKLLGANFG